MQELIDFYNTLNTPLVVIFWYVVIWGVFEGVKGVWSRMVCLFSKSTYLQNELGKFLQSLWYVGLGVLVVIYIGV